MLLRNPRDWSMGSMLPVSQTQTELGSDWYPDRVQVIGLEKQLHRVLLKPSD